MCWRSQIVLAIAILGMSSPVLAQRDTDFPYQALTLNEQTIVRSGPGNVHYETDELGQGQIVEVHRHDPGGWCAIRPPAGSFSLIPESAIQPLDDSIGVISVEGVQAWVGTRMGSVEQPMWQVKLKQDERVQILGQASWPNPDGTSTIWYQVSPPAGEFRWVQLSDLQLPHDLVTSSTKDEPAATPVKNEPVVDRDVQQARYSLSEENDGFGRVVQAALQTPVEIERSLNSGWRKAKIPARKNATQQAKTTLLTPKQGPFQTPAIDPSKSRRLLSKSDGVTGPVSRVAAASGVMPVSPKMPELDLTPPNTILPLKNESPRDRLLESSPNFPSFGDGSTVTKKISELEMLLTKEMTRNPDQWRFKTLEDQAMAIQETTQNADEKMHAERFLGKIRECKRIRSNYESAYVTNASDSLSRQLKSNAPVGTGIEQELLHSTTYDAYGWLNELVSKQDGNQASYVLEDDNGRIIYHVAPSPGLNLNRYLKSKVGVIGRRGYHRKLQLSHVTAERVVVLEKLR